MFKVTARPAELACMAGEELRLGVPPPRAGDARLGVVSGDARLGVAMMEGDARLRLVMEGEGRAPAGEFIMPPLGVGEWRIAGEFTLLDGRQCFTESDPD